MVYILRRGNTKVKTAAARSNNHKKNQGTADVRGNQLIGHVLSDDGISINYLNDLVQRNTSL